VPAVSSTLFVVVFDALLLGAAGLMASQGRSVPALSILGAFAILAVWQISLASTVSSFSRHFRWEPFFRPTHYVQALLHTTIYTYLGLYWEGVARYAPLIVTQIILGYLLDMLIAWSRGRVWRVGLGIIPIVLSTNLFLWFREPRFFLQIGLIALTFFGKEFVTWNYGGRRRHIFNPSAFSLSLVSIVLLATNTVETTHAVDIAAAFESPPNYYEVIFLLGLVVQGLFVVTPVSFGAALAFWLIHAAANAIDVGHIPNAQIPTAVFLGMTFLVTDPATSPRSHFGRFLFGLAYGVGVTATFVALRFAHLPAIFDKLLIVCVVNLFVPLIDGLCDRLAGRRNVDPPPAPAPASHLARFGWLFAYIALIVFMMPDLKTKKPQTRPSLLPGGVGYISPDVRGLLKGMMIGRREFPEAYRPFGFRGEIEHIAEIRELYRTNQDASSAMQYDLPREFQ
jgi:Na+-translocating ferredoxin:NAD+ oxidoreductase RnfD subunit